MRYLKLGLGLLVAALVALLLPAISSEGREPRTRVDAYFSPDGGVTKAIGKELRGARRSIDVAVYVLSSPALATDLVAAHKRGVRVRVVLDARMSRRWSQAGELEEHEVPLRRLVVPRKASDHSDPSFHHKFAVIDGETVLTGSFNWTVMAEERNHENLLVIRNADLAETYTKVFEQAWALAGDTPER